MQDPSARRLPRNEWPVRVLPLRDAAASSDNLAGTLPPAELVALLWELSARMWELTGNPLPAYARASIPVKVVPRA
jgi:hypothetical protein